MDFMDNKKLISYVGCGLLIVVVIYFILTVLKISGDTFKLNMVEGFGDDDEKTSPKLKKKKKAFEKATDKFFGEDEKEGQIDIVINKRKKRLDVQLVFVDLDTREVSSLNKSLIKSTKYEITIFNILADIESKIQKHETIIAAVNVGKVAKSGIASKYVQQVVQYGLAEKYGELDM